MVGQIVILLYACKLAFLASSTCLKIIKSSPKNEARKAYLHLHKRIIIMPAIMKDVYSMMETGVTTLTGIILWCSWARHITLAIIMQGPKLTVLCRRQLATEIFFQSPNGKIWSPKSGS